MSSYIVTSDQYKIQKSINKSHKHNNFLIYQIMIKKVPFTDYRKMQIQSLKISEMISFGITCAT